MKVSYLKIKNVAGIEELEINPGNITEITGKNGGGKSSVLRAIDNIFGGGNLAEIRNLNTDENPEIVVMLDDGAIQIKKTGSGLTVKQRVDGSAAMEKVAAPQRFINSLIDGKLTNPVKLLEAKPKERTGLMLNAIPLPFERDQFLSECGIVADEYEAIPDGLHPLVEIDHYKDMVFKRRTGCNTEARKANDSADKLLRTVPFETPEKVDTGTAEKALDEIKAKRTTLSSDAQHAQFDKRNKAEQKRDAFLADAKREYERELEKLNAKLLKQQSFYESEFVESCKKADAEFSAEKEKDAELALQQQQLEIEILNAKGNDIERVRIEEIKKIACQMERDAEQAKAKSNELTTVLKAVEAFKSELCSNLPISGLSVSDGDILIDGVPWEQVNTARRVEVAVAVSALRAKKQQLKIIWVDDAEHLDADTLKMLKGELEKNEMQPFIARVSDGKLAVNSEG